MSSAANRGRRPTVHITFSRAARLYRLVRFLAEKPRSRSAILMELRVGLRTFYRELDLLSRRDVKVHYKSSLYHLAPAVREAEGRLPFPDPQLSFAELAQLAKCACPAAARLAELLAAVTNPAMADVKKRAKKASHRKKSSP